MPRPRDAVDLVEGVWGLIFGDRGTGPAPATPHRSEHRLEPAVVRPVRRDPAEPAPMIVDGHVAAEVIEPLAPPPPAADLSAGRATDATGRVRFSG